jgi:hypothetical protein
VQHTHTRADHWLWVSSVIPRHTIFDLFLIFILLQHLGETSPTPTLYLCTIAKLYHLRISSASLSVAVLFLRVPDYAFGRSSASSLLLQRRFYMVVRPSVPPLHDNSLGVIMLRYVFNIFIVVVRLLRRLPHANFSTVCVTYLLYVQCNACSVALTIPLYMTSRVHH